MLILCIIPFSGSSALSAATSQIVITATAGRGIVLKFDNGIGETSTNLSDLGFKVGEASVQVISGGENSVGGGNKGVEISEYPSFKRWLWLLPRRLRLLPRKWMLGPGSMV